MEAFVPTNPPVSCPATFSTSPIENESVILIEVEPINPPTLVPFPLTSPPDQEFVIVAEFPALPAKPPTIPPVE